MTECKNCGHKIRIYPFSQGNKWMHSYIFKNEEGIDMVSYSINCKCGCIKLEPKTEVKK